MAGLSGSGIFIKQKEGVSCLSHIQFAVKAPNQLNAIRLDLLLDEINDVIKDKFPEADRINSQNHLVLENERLDFTEYGNLDFFKEKIKYELPAYQKELKKLFSSKDSINAKIDEIVSNAINKNSDSMDQELIRSLLPHLRNKHNEIINQTKGLSYIYAYLAVASENYAAQTRYSLFKKAISLNPEHQQTFLLQKQKSAGNTDAMKKAVENSLIDTIALYDQLIADQKNELIKIRIIEEGLLKVYDFNSKNNDELRSECLKHYFKQLEYTLKKSSMIREFYKYIILGDSYSRFFNNKEAILYFYQVAIRILEKSPANENDNKTLEQLKEQSLRITEEFATDLSEDQHQKAIAEAEEILAKQEDKELKTSVSEVKQMMFAVHEELRNIKTQNRGQSSTLESLELQLNEISADHFQKDQVIDFNIHEANKHIDLLGNSTKSIKEYIDNMPRNYELVLNNDFKQDISYLIQSQVGQNIDNLLMPFVDSIDKKSEKLTTRIQEFTTNAEKSIESINSLKAQKIKDSEDNLVQLTASFNKDASDKISSFKEEAKELNDFITEKIASLTRVQDFSNEEKQLIMKSLDSAQSFFDSSAKTIRLKAGTTEIDLGNQIRIIAGNLSGLVEAQNRNFITLAKSLLTKEKKQSAIISDQPNTALPSITVIETADGKSENPEAAPNPSIKKLPNKQNFTVRLVKSLLFLLLLILIISGAVLMNRGM